MGKINGEEGSSPIAPLLLFLRACGCHGALIPGWWGEAERKVLRAMHEPSTPRMTVREAVRQQRPIAELARMLPQPCPVPVQDSLLAEVLSSSAAPCPTGLGRASHRRDVYPTSVVTLMADV